MRLRARITLLTIAILAGCTQNSNPLSIPSDNPASGAPAFANASPAAMTASLNARHSLARPDIARQLSRWIQTRGKRQLPIRRAGVQVGSWVTDFSSYIWGIYKGKIVTYLSDCHGAQGAVVDHAGNLVVACSFDSDVKIYNAGNTTGPADRILADTPYYSIADAFEDNSGNIYATNLFGPIQNSQLSPGNIVEWAAGSPNGSQPTQTITDPNLAQYYFGDVDAHGNIYVDGLTSFFTQTAEVDEITGGVAKNLGISMNFPGGVYVVRPNSASPELSVIDQGTPADLIPPFLYVYKLPFTGAPVFVDNPPENVQKTCDPIAGGYNATGRTILIGDANCHSRDRGIVKLNTWRTLSNIDFYYPVDAAFTQSDK